MKEDVKEKRMFLSNVTELTMTENEHISIDDLIQQGMTRRAVSSTDANAQSSRSHSLFTFYLKQKVEGSFITSKLNIIDLAGSER